MLDLLKEMFSYPFMVRAILVGTIVALCSSLLGVSLVLKRYSMIGDGLSHVGFGALALATALNMAPLTISIPIVVLAAFLLLRINESSRIKGDDRSNFHWCIGHRGDGHLFNHRNEYGCVQLSVRKHSEHVAK